MLANIMIIWVYITISMPVGWVLCRDTGEVPPQAQYPGLPDILAPLILPLNVVYAAAAIADRQAGRKSPRPRRQRQGIVDGSRPGLLGDIKAANTWQPQVRERPDSLRIGWLSCRRGGGQGGRTASPWGWPPPGPEAGPGARQSHAPAPTPPRTAAART